MNDRPWMALVLGIAGLAWVLTLSPGIRLFIDVGELQAVGWTFGGAHPTGFPLYVLLAGGFAHLFPVGEVAWRLNLFSALCGLGALATLFRVLRLVGTVPPVAAAGALAFGLLPMVWRYSVVAEVYTLYLLLAGRSWAALLRWRAGEGERWLGIAVIWSCLGVAVHPLMALAAPGLLWVALRAEPRAVLRSVPVGLGALSLAVLFYGWLWLRLADPTTPIVYREVTDLVSFLQFIRGAEFEPSMLQAVPAGRIDELMEAAGLQTMVAAGLAFAVLWLRDRAVAGGMALAVAAHTIFLLGYRIQEIVPYILPLAWFATVGCGPVLSRLAVKAPRLGLLVPLGAIALVPLNRGAARLPEARQEQAEVEALAELMGPDSLLVTNRWALSGAMWAHYYTHGTEARRRWVFAGPPTPGSLWVIGAYLRGESGIVLRQQRRTLPPGMALFVSGEIWRVALEEDGMTLHPVAADIWRVSLR